MRFAKLTEFWQRRTPREFLPRYVRPIFGWIWRNMHLYKRCTGVVTDGNRMGRAFVMVWQVPGLSRRNTMIECRFKIMGILRLVCAIQQSLQKVDLALVYYGSYWTAKKLQVEFDTIRFGHPLKSHINQVAFGTFNPWTKRTRGILCVQLALVMYKALLYCWKERTTLIYCLGRRRTAFFAKRINWNINVQHIYNILFFVDCNGGNLLHLATVLFICNRRVQHTCMRCFHSS